jgi:DNA-binding ferritin-like protein
MLRQEALDVLMQLWYDTKSLHWYTRNKTFFSLHEVYENLYNDVLVWHDRLAEQFIGDGAIVRPWADVKPKKGFDSGPQNQYEVVHVHDMLRNVKSMLAALHAEESDLGILNAIEDVTEEVNAWLYKFRQARLTNQLL